MAQPDANEYGGLATGRGEYIKQYITYDASNRMEFVYEAASNARDQTPCLRTQYTYWTTSTRVRQMKETKALWLSAFDIP